MRDPTFFKTWQGIVNRIVQSLPENAAERERLIRLREEIGRYLSGKMSKPEEIEEQLLSFAVDAPDLLVDAAEGMMSEVFQLIDPEIERCRRAKENHSLTDKDRTMLKTYLELLERSGDNLGHSNGNEEISRAPLASKDR